MRTFLLFPGAAFAALMMQAQTNAPVAETNVATPTALTNLSPGPVHSTFPTPTNAVPKPPTEIFSDSGEFDLKTRVAVYLGNVRVVDPQMKLSCEKLTVVVPEEGGRVDHIVAETNVVIDAADNEGNPVRATSQKAVYTYKIESSVTNELIELTGDPYVDSKAAKGYAERIVWDRVQNRVHMFKQRSVLIQQGMLAPASNPPAPAVPEQK